MEITVVQWCPSFGEKESNWKRMEEFSESSGSDIIVFPELFSSGYNYDGREEILVHSDTAERLSVLKSISASKGKLIVGGFPEIDGGDLYDAAFAISAGRASIYRKIHLWAKETQIFSPGGSSLVVDYRGAKVGIEICYDLQFPELGRLMYAQGADIMLCPMAWAEEPTYKDKSVPPFVHLAIAQSFSNGVFTAIANRVGTERGAVFEGHSGIADPFGNFEGLARGEGTFSLEVDLSDVKAARNPSPYNELERDRRLNVTL